VELKAPAGKFRVVGLDLFSHEHYLMGDYGSRARVRSPDGSFRFAMPR
jgi:hypothetical protein